MSQGDKKTSEVLESLQEKGDTFTKLSVIERKRQADLEDAITHVTVETEKFRAKAKSSAIEVMNLHILTPNPAYQRADGITVGRDAEVVTKKALNVMEARLNKLLQRRSEVINYIKHLKHEVNHFRRMRLQTDTQHAKYEAILSETRSGIEKFLSESTAIVEERDRLLEKRDALERINVEEQKSFQEDYEEMGLFIKDQNVALEDALLRERKRDRLEKKGLQDPSLASTRQGEMSLEEELEMAKQVGSLTDFVMSEQNSLSGIQEKINNYEMMFDQLKKMSGVASLEEVISTYVEQEEEMFSLYNFIQTVNAEIDTVVENTVQLETNISSFQSEQKDSENQKKGVLDELQQKLQVQLNIIRELEEQNKLQQECVAQISKKVSSLFFKLQCDQMDSKSSSNAANGGNVVVAPAAGGVGGGAGANAAKGNNKNNNSSATQPSSGVAASSSSSSRPESKIAILTSQGVSESNVLDYMGCIEQRAVNIIAEFIRFSKHAGSHQQGLLLGTGDNRTVGPHSPTPGPTTPMQWPMEAIGDLGDLGDEDWMGDVGAGAAGDDNNDKLVDLNAFKERLKKKLNSSLGQSAGNGGNNNGNGTGNSAVSGGGFNRDNLPGGTPGSLGSAGTAGAFGFNSSSSNRESFTKSRSSKK